MCLNKELIFRRRLRRQRGQNAKDKNKNEGKINCIEMKWWQNAHYHTFTQVHVYCTTPSVLKRHETIFMPCPLRFYLNDARAYIPEYVGSEIVVDSVRFLGRNNFVYFIRQTNNNQLRQRQRNHVSWEFEGLVVIRPKLTSTTLWWRW